jgi:hypothetical protein
MPMLREQMLTVVDGGVMMLGTRLWVAVLVMMGGGGNDAWND